MMKHTGVCKSLYASNKGSTGAVVICIVFVVVLASAVLTDIGYITVERFKLEGLADKLVRSTAEALAAGKADLVKAIKEDAAAKEGRLESLDIKFPSNGKEVSVYIQKRLNYIFLRFFGMNDKKITAQVTVKVSGVSSCKGLRPLGIFKENVKYDSRVVLSTSSRQRNPGMILIDTGNKSFEADIKYGSLSHLTVGDTVLPYIGANPVKVCSQLDVIISKCRHLPRCTLDKHASECSRIILLPVIQKEKVPDSEGIKITGFCAFLMEKAAINGEDLEITGSFIRHVIKSDTSDGVPDFGLRGIKIIK